MSKVIIGPDGKVPEFYTTAEVATLLGISTSTVSRWVHEGDLAAERVERKRPRSGGWDLRFPSAQFSGDIRRPARTGRRSAS